MWLCITLGLQATVQSNTEIHFYTVFFIFISNEPGSKLGLSVANESTKGTENKTSMDGKWRFFYQSLLGDSNGVLSFPVGSKAQPSVENDFDPYHSLLQMIGRHNPGHNPLGQNPPLQNVTEGGSDLGVMSGGLMSGHRFKQPFWDQLSRYVIAAQLSHYTVSLSAQKNFYSHDWVKWPLEVRVRYWSPGTSVFAVCSHAVLMF